MSLLSVRSLCVEYQSARGTVRAVDDVSFDLDAGETVGLVGESGCGKSTLGKAIMRLVPSSDGFVVLDGQNLTEMQPRALKAARRNIQMIFQDPYSSLNPRHDIGTIVGQPLSVAGWSRRDIRDRVAELMGQVGLPAEAVRRYPHEFSGGQRQRIGIARALALSPRVIICDEPVSALDVSVRAQVINLLKDLQQATGVSYLFISHDLSVVEHISDRLHRDVSRPHRRKRPRRGHLAAAGPSLYQRAAGGGAGRRSAAGAWSNQERAAGRIAEPAESSAGLQLQHPLPDGTGALPARTAGAPGKRGRAHGRLPLRSARTARGVSTCSERGQLTRPKGSLANALA